MGFKPFMHPFNSLCEIIVFFRKRRQPELLLSTARAYIQNIIFFSPLNFIRFLPGEERHKRRIGLFIALLFEIIVNNWLIFQTEFSKLYNNNLPLLMQYSAFTTEK